MVTDDLLAYYTFAKEVLYDTSMGMIRSVFPIRSVERCYLYNVSFSTHILDATLEILLDYTLEIIYSIINDKGELERISEMIQKDKMLTVDLKRYPLLMEQEEGQVSFHHWVTDASYEAKIVDESKIQLTVHATIEGSAARRPYLNLCMLGIEEPREDLKAWEDPIHLSRQLAQVRKNLDIAHERLSEKNYIIDGLIQVLRAWEKKES
jgi:hypothetical protein